MKILNLSQTFKNKTKSKLTFRVNQDLLLAGFKFCYVTPEKIEEQVVAQCRDQEFFSSNKRTDCLEECLMNRPEDICIDTHTQTLNINWIHSYATLKL
jgi:hypothetical protein